MSRDPILIAGDGRSGTTLVSVMLDCHPTLSVGAELHFRSPENLGSEIIETLNLKMALSSDDWNDLRHNNKYKRNFHFITRVLRWGITESDLLAIIKKVNNSSPLTSFRERAALVEMLGTQRAEKKGALKWGFKIMRDLPLYQTYLTEWPRAKFIFIVRDGRDVFASQYTDHSSWGYTSAENAASGWVKLIDVACEIQRKMPRQILIVRYEDLVKRSESSIQTLCDFLHVETSYSMMEFHSSETSYLLKDYGHPSGLQVTNQISSNSIGRYKIDLTSEQIKIFETQSKRHLQAFGYI